MKYALLALLCLSFSLALALESRPGSGSRVWPQDSREYNFSYHSGTDDFHFYGSNIWAVRFNFAEVYPQSLASEFLVSKALLWLPQTGDSVRVELFTDFYGGPGTSLASAQAEVTSNQLEIPFSNPVQGDSLWLVVTYNTNFANRFVAASAGGGSRSYYWNTNDVNPYFQSLAEAGFNSELLFGLAGDFVLSGPDLQLTEFELEGSLQPRQQVGPTFAIYNHSDLTVYDANVMITVTSPESAFVLQDTVWVPEPIPPRSEYVFNAQSPGFAGHQFSLPDQPLQLKLRAVLDTLIAPSLPAEPLANNRITINRFSLADEYPVWLAENFLRAGNSVQITATQDPFDFPAVHILNYFPILSDSLANVPAQIRFNWYNFNTLPRTVVNGDLRLNGFSASYTGQYQQHCQDAQALKTFVSGSNCRLEHIPQNDLISAEITFSNTNTLLWATANEYNLVSSSCLNVGIFRKVFFDGAERYVIDRWIAHGEPLSGPLGAGEELSVSFNVSLSNLSLAELAQGYRLYYWLQLAGGGRILYSAYSDFTDVVASQDEVCPVPELRLGPNPLRGNGSLRISLAGGRKLGTVRIYNLRGQKIIEIAGAGDELNLSASQFPASGIYLLRVEHPLPQGKTTILNKKINIIK
ncbi:MAG: T9SS type A sorting domain-containing protein [Candidatus Cloacimonetes bacterium]|nr:T9SS type A sorting domain-containing protein [Candidatus Cloacimonadota bacterium]